MAQPTPSHRTSDKPVLVTNQSGRERLIFSCSFIIDTSKLVLDKGTMHRTLRGTLITRIKHRPRTWAIAYGPTALKIPEMPGTMIYLRGFFERGFFRIINADRSPPRTPYHPDIQSSFSTNENEPDFSIGLGEMK